MSDGWRLASKRGLRRWVVMLLAVAVAASQQKALPEPTEAEIANAIEGWLATDQIDEAGLQQTVAMVLAKPEIGIALLGRFLKPSLVEPAQKRSVGLRSISLHTILGLLDKARGSGMSFRGQYSALAHLQPLASEQVTQLLLQTPDWYPDTHRIRLIPVLRDLQPSAPAEAVLLGVIDLVQSVEMEPADLRLELACLLWQWGRKEYVEPFLARMRKESADGDAENRLVATRELAHFWYQIGQYEKAATTHTVLQQLAASARVPLTPTDWYWAACCHALAGDVERGIAALERCTELLADDAVDPSRKLPKVLFEKDPEIARLRTHTRFPILIAKAFPTAATDKGR